MKPNDGSVDPTLTPSQAGDAALTETAAATATPTDVTGAPVTFAPAGYRLGELLGRGGMGEVVLAEELDIGRDVAIKRMRGGALTADAEARFLREARIQARLDHPAVVPVHHLGRDTAGRPYFTMKRLAGTTLAEMLDKRSETMQRLLRALVDVCRAIQFAHARGVIHRDLKPSNIMLGEYGEVYVLDWGVARVLAESDTPGGAAIESLDGQTQVGAVLGTPGYMSPEQVRGESLTPATDVYALGSILFEILAEQPLHPRGAAALTTTLSNPPTRPSLRVPDRAIAPELDDACRAALAAAAADRPSARELADRIERYLDGDRDVEQRRAIAQEELANARAAIASGDPARRADAMRAAGRALALDPQSQGAASLVTQMMLEPPSEPPPVLAERLADVDMVNIRTQARIAAYSSVSYIVFVPLLLYAGVKEWSTLVMYCAFAILNFGFSLWVYRTNTPRITWAVLLNLAMMVAISRLASPIILVPAIATGTIAMVVSFPTLARRPLWAIIAIAGGFVLPVALEWLGLWSRSWWFADDGMVISPPALRLDPMVTSALVIGGYVTTVLVTGLFVASLARAARENQRKLETQAWHYEHLLPVEPPTRAAPPTHCVI